ncbi:DUF721 domain-containing protein [Verrucomicrobia bacterium S94]|nr:DUF721 domain-containing protein [Verrucomicrobia bacterium S94]
MEQPRHSRKNNSRWELDRVRYHLNKPMAPRRDMKSVAEILKDVVSDFDQPVQESVVVLRNAWEKLAGPQIASHSEPGFIKDHALTVFVDHPGWVPELERMKRPLLFKLQSNFTGMQIRHLRFELKHG